MVQIESHLILYPSCSPQRR
jgi:predicted CDP-diglyceride synthetase/phosphatidate cytidylyltransferase